MVRTELEAIVGNLGAFYERKAAPSEMTLVLWLQKVKNIPSEAIPWIQSKIMDECESWPKNITAIMWAMYHAWLAAHPEKRAHLDHVDCPDCEGGWLAIRKRVEPYRQPISHSAPCGRCKQIPASQYMTMFQALESGYERIDLRTYQAHTGELGRLIESIGKKMEKPRVYAD